MKYSLLVVLSFFTLPAIALAGGSKGFVPLVGIPGLSNASAPTFDDYVDALYALAISVAALIAVIQIVLGGAQYMMDDLISSKSAAKERIKNALIGLLIIIAAALILTTINSNLTKLDIKAPAINIDNDKPQAQLDTYKKICDTATNDNTQCGYKNCDGIAARNMQVDNSSTGNIGLPTRIYNTCSQICRDVYGGNLDTDWINQCFYTQATADQCDPQRSVECCEEIKAGKWNESASANKCSDLDQATADRIKECYEKRMTWDNSYNTCRNNICNPNTDALCCMHWSGGTYDTTTKTCSSNILLPNIDPNTNYTYQGKAVQITPSDSAIPGFAGTVTVKFDANNNGIFGESGDGETQYAVGCGWVTPSACSE